MAATKNSDVAVLVIGTNKTVEGEGHDRETIELPGVQEQLVKAVIATGKPGITTLVEVVTLSRIDSSGGRTGERRPAGNSIPERQRSRNRGSLLSWRDGWTSNC